MSKLLQRGEGWGTWTRCILHPMSYIIIMSCILILDYEHTCTYFYPIGNTIMFQYNSQLYDRDEEAR